MPPRACVVSLVDNRGVRHSVDVTADTLFESAAIGLQLLREHDWVDQPGPATRLEITVNHPSVRHEVTVRQIERWADSTAITPDERVRKDRVRKILTTAPTRKR